MHNITARSCSEIELEEERSLADFYGICADDPIAIDDGGIDEELDNDMEGAFDEP